MSLLLDLLSWACLVGGGAFLVVGGIGVLRLPDFFSRLHAAGITDTGGASLILIGLMFQSGANLITVKLALILLFLMLTSPTSSHALAKAALSDRVLPVADRQEVEPSNS